MDSNRKLKMIRIAQENPSLRKAVLRILNREASGASWWLYITLEKTTILHTPVGNDPVRGKRTPLKEKERFSSLDQLFARLRTVVGYLKDLRLVRWPSKSNPNSAEIWGSIIPITAGKLVQEDYVILITKGERISPEDLQELRDKFLAFNHSRIIDVTSEAQRMMTYYRPVGESSVWARGPERYQDYSTTRTQRGPNTPKGEMDEDINERLRKINWG